MLSNLALLCRRHHRAVHEEGYRIERQSDGELRFRRPDGRHLPEVPVPAAVPTDPVEALRARHAGQGLRLHARTGLAGWLGERLDVGWAIDVLHPGAESRTRYVYRQEWHQVHESIFSGRRPDDRPFRDSNWETIL
jgi:hypothetical protein